MLIEEFLSRNEGQLKVLVIEFWVDHVDTMLSKVGRFNATWDAVPTVEEEDFHGLVFAKMDCFDTEDLGVC